jgi:nicotinamide-nucleotide amidase
MTATPKPSQSLEKLAIEALARCRARGLRVATAESCTGGLVAGALTEIAGSSDVIEGGFVTYSNTAKSRLLDVPEALIATLGAVSREVACAMAEGVLAKLPSADIAVAVTGIAGPGGGNAEKPVGLVHFALARRGRATAPWHEIFSGNRAEIRRQSVISALRALAADAPPDAQS